MPCAIATLLGTSPACRVPRQDSTNAQLADVEALIRDRDCSAAADAEKALIANRLGMYDAADIFRVRAAKAKVTTAA